MGKFFTIKTPDNHIIYWTLNSKIKSDKLVIFVHGLSGNQSIRIIFNGAKFLVKKWFDTFRRNLYNSSIEKARELKTVYITDNACDIETLVKHFKKTYIKIFVIGHSLWWLAILKTNPKNINSAILRDGSLDPYDWKKNTLSIKNKIVT